MNVFNEFVGALQLSATIFIVKDSVLLTDLASDFSKDTRFSPGMLACTTKLI